MHAKILPFVLAIFLPPVLFAQDYDIRLARPVKPGEEYKLSVVSKQSQSMNLTVNGVTTKETKHELSIQFDGVEKVIEVNATGQETKITITIEKITKTTDGTTTEVVPKGTIIVSTVVDKRNVHEIDGKAVDREIAEALNMVISMGEDTEVFGTTERKKKGDSWDINTAKAKQSFEKSADGVVMNDLSGKTTLDDVTGDTMKITARFTSSLKLPLPPSFTVDQSAMEGTYHGVFPVDLAKYPPEEAQVMSITLSAHADSPSGEKALLKATMGQSLERKTTLVK